MPAQTLRLNDREITLRRFDGELMDHKRWNSTHVSGGGTSGSGPQVRVAPVTSINTVHDQVLLRDATGRERDFRLEGVELPARLGHRLTMIWGATGDDDRGPLVCAINLKTGWRHDFAAGRNGLVDARGYKAVVSFGWVLAALILFLPVIAAKGGTLLALAGIAAIVIGFRERSLIKRRRRALDTAIEALVNGGAADDPDGALSAMAG